MSYDNKKDDTKTSNSAVNNTESKKVEAKTPAKKPAKSFRARKLMAINTIADENKARDWALRLAMKRGK